MTKKSTSIIIPVCNKEEATGATLGQSEQLETIHP